MPRTHCKLGHDLRGENGARYKNHGKSDAWLDADINSSDIESRFGVRCKDVTSLFGPRPARQMLEWGGLRRRSA